MTQRILASLLFVVVCVSCGVVKKPGWRSIRQPDNRTAAVARLAEIDRAYAELGSNSELIDEEQRLLQAWLDGLESLEGKLSGELLQKYIEIDWKGHDPALITRLLPAARIRDLYTDKKHVRKGVGLPVVVYVEEDQDRHLMSQSGRTYGLTARLRARSGNKPLLQLIDSSDTEAIDVGGAFLPLAADFSAHSDYYWEVSDVDNVGFLGLFRPGADKLAPRLYLTEDYDPQKIPLIFVHGLTSSPVIWAPVGADLRSQADLRKRYQIWHFSYPTGTAWVNTSSAFRDQVHSARRRLDPERKNPAWEKMVIVGHSMGGLVSRTAVSVNTEELYDAVFNRPLAELNANEKQVERIRRTLLAKPLSEPSRLIFIATPHRGSSMADWGIIHWLSGLILLPTDLVQNSFDIVTRNQFAVSSSFFARGHLPTGLDTLSPRSPFIKAMERMRMQDDLSVHSVIGVKEFSLSGRRTDGIVPYNSAHLDNVESELVVPYGHSMTERRLVKAEILRLLRLHLEP